MTDSIELITGVSILIVTPALVEVAKQLGLPTRLAGLAAILLATMMVILGDLAAGTTFGTQTSSRWIIAGIVYGLAAAGLYSQTRVRDKPPFQPAT